MKYNGIVSNAAQTTGISRETHYNWLKTDKIYSDKAQLAREAVADKAERILIDLLDSENEAISMGASDRILKAYGKNRGYGGKPATVNANTQVNVGGTLNQLIAIQEEHDRRRKDTECGVRM